MVIVKLIVQVNIHESILNMGFKQMAWLWPSLAEAETEKTLHYLSNRLSAITMSKFLSVSLNCDQQRISNFLPPDHGSVAQSSW